MTRRIAAGASPGEYWFGRPITVADDLTRLQGPAGGEVRLLLALDWTPRESYNLDDEQDRRSMYEVLIREARDESHLEQYLNEALLREIWGSLFLPKLVREEWEAQHPSLVA